MVSNGTTGVVIPVPAADELLTSVAGRFPGAVREGVPAHVSVMYPFLSAELLDEHVLSTLRSLLARQAPMELSFGECRRHEGFVYLRPHQQEALLQLTAALQEEWPHLVPYGGRHAVTEPHVSVAMGLLADSAAVVEDEVCRWLPITARLDQAWLVVFDGQWQLCERFSFAA